MNRHFLAACLAALLACGGLRAEEPQTDGDSRLVTKVMLVTGAGAAKIEAFHPVLIVGATGLVSDTGWLDAKLVPYFYLVPPADGIWDLDLVATRIPGIHVQVLTPVFATRVLPNPPPWVRGVRIHAVRNTMEAMVSPMLTVATPAAEERKDVKSGSIRLEATYEHEGNRHCLVVKAKVELHGFEKEFELGRFCIEAGSNSVGGEKDIGSGVTLHWRLSLKNNKLCFSAHACKDFPWPIGELCTPEASVCVDVSH